MRAQTSVIRETRSGRTGLCASYSQPRKRRGDNFTWNAPFALAGFSSHKIFTYQQQTLPQGDIHNIIQYMSCKIERCSSLFVWNDRICSSSLSLSPYLCVLLPLNGFPDRSRPPVGNVCLGAILLYGLRGGCWFVLSGVPFFCTPTLRSLPQDDDHGDHDHRRARRNFKGQRLSSDSPAKQYRDDRVHVGNGAHTGRSAHFH